MSTSLFKDMIKNTNEQIDEDVQILRSGRVASIGASVPMELGCVTVLIRRSVHSPGSYPYPILLEFLWRLPHIGIINY